MNPPDAPRRSSLGLIPAILAGLILRRTGAVLAPVEPPRGPRNGSVTRGGLGLRAQRRRGGQDRTGRCSGSRARSSSPSRRCCPQSLRARAPARRPAPAHRRSRSTAIRPPPPNLQADPYVDIDAKEADEAARLSGLRLSRRGPHPRAHPDRPRHGADGRPAPRPRTRDRSGTREGAGAMKAQSALALWPPAASAAAVETDHIILGFTVLTLLLTVPVFLAITYFALRYRAGRTGRPQHRRAPQLPHRDQLDADPLRADADLLRLGREALHRLPEPAARRAWWWRRWAGNGCGSSSIPPASPRSTTCTCPSTSRSASASPART